MQTFLPYPDLRASSVVLDDRRLGKQRVETFQILRALTWPDYAWKNHPAVRMWRGFVPALVLYGLENCREWTRRGYADSVAPQLLAWSGGREPVAPALPVWFGMEALHLSHRSALLRKEPDWYEPLFTELGEPRLPNDLPYLWPPDVFPRWPVHGHLVALPVHVALRVLGFDAPRAGQAGTAEAVAAGRDVLLACRPGSGGSAAGLLAGLATAGRTLWIHPAEGRRAPAAPAVPLPPVRSAAPAPAVGATPLARRPGPDDLLAMQAEAEPPEFVFVASDALPVPGAIPAEVGLVVVDRADQLSDGQAAQVTALREVLGWLPLLIVVGRADAEHRAELVSRFALRDPVHAGGGWDPGSLLATRAVGSASARRQAILSLVRDGGPALVVSPSRQRSQRLALALVAGGLRAAAWAPSPMRGSTSARVLGDWRSRRLDCLVVPAGPLPALGRRRPMLLVGDEPASLDDWRDLVASVGAKNSVLVAGPHADADVRRYAATADDPLPALLDRYGEPPPESRRG